MTFVKNIDSLVDSRPSQIIDSKMEAWASW